MEWLVLWNTLGLVAIVVVFFSFMFVLGVWTGQRILRSVQAPINAMQNYGQGLRKRIDQLPAASQNARLLLHENGQKPTPITVAECVVINMLSEELEAAMRDWICGPQEFESGARERIKLAWERARAALKYAEELQGQAG